jgi:hypothetical protein
VHDISRMYSFSINLVLRYEGMSQADMEARIAQMEQEFGQKRAKFMELFKQKEGNVTVNA